MTTLPAPVDAIAESQRLIVALEQRRGDLPFADDVLATHRTMHRELELSHSSSQEAVAAWRAALAHRWECEVAARRIYKQVMRQLVEFYGTPDASPVMLLSRGGAEVDSSPTELLEDLRRLNATLTIDDAPPFAAARVAQVEELYRALEDAVAQAKACEHRRRTAVLDSRMVREVYRRVRGETMRAVVDHYGKAIPSIFGGLV